VRFAWDSGGAHAKQKQKQKQNPALPVSWAYNYMVIDSTYVTMIRKDDDY
jgi:hypothetical protein